MPSKKQTATAQVNSNELTEGLRKEILTKTFGDDYESHQKAIEEILSARLHFFNVHNLSLIVPQTEQIISKYASFIMDFRVKIPLKGIKSTIDDLSSSISGIDSEQKLKIALDRIKGVLANKYVYHKTDEEIEKDKLIGIMRAKYEPQMRPNQFKSKYKSSIILLNRCYEILQSKKTFTIEQFKDYLRHIPKDMLDSQLQNFIVKYQ